MEMHGATVKANVLDTVHASVIAFKRSKFALHLPCSNNFLQNRRTNELPKFLLAICKQRKYLTYTKRFVVKINT
jgi:hypothetical protein